MKRALLVLGLVALAACAGAQTVVRETSVTVAWDAPPLELPDDTLTYRVYIENTLTGARTMVAEVAALEQAVTVPYRAVWRIGVSAVLDGNESAIAWSTVAADCDAGETFLVRPKGQPGKPSGLEVP